MVQFQIPRRLNLALFNFSLLLVANTLFFSIGDKNFGIIQRATTTTLLRQIWARPLSNLLKILTPNSHLAIGLLLFYTLLAPVDCLGKPGGLQLRFAASSV